MFIVIEEDKKSEGKGCFKNIVPAIKRKAKKCCSKKMLHRRLPILTWLPKYTTEDAMGDLVAGITVGLTVIPQSLAYSNIAGLPAQVSKTQLYIRMNKDIIFQFQYGLYGSFLGCLIYILFGSCKDVPMGPTAIASLLTFQIVNGKGPEHAILLCFLSGLIELLMGILGLGKKLPIFRNIQIIIKCLF